MLSSNTNASAVEAGFHYQDVAALYLFLSNIKELDSFEVEGEEDIDLNWKNGSKSFIQSKETMTPYKTFNKKYLANALSILSDDLTKHKKEDVKSLVFLTNSHFPFGIRAGQEFNNNGYLFYTYKDLPPKMQNKILKITESLKSCSIDYNLLRIIKIEYSGSDNRTKLRLLRESVEEFMDLANIPLGKYQALLYGWTFLVSHSSEYPRKKIKKDEFAGYTSLVYLDDTSRIEKFFEEFDVSYTDEEYIRNQYNEYLKPLTVNMDIINKVNALIIKYNKNHQKPFASRREYEKDFVNQNCQKLAVDLGIESKEEKDLAVAKFIMWLVVINKTNFDNIKKALN